MGDDEFLFDQWREGVETSDGLRVQWVGNRRLGTLQVQERAWTSAFRSELVWEVTQTFEGDALDRSFDTSDSFAIPQVGPEEFSFDAWRAGVETADGKRVTWVGNRAAGVLEIEEQVSRLPLTLENYNNVLIGQTFEVRDDDGNAREVQGGNLFNSFMNTLTVTVPATIIPILIAAFAAYAFAWMDFPFRRVLFILVIALLVVPLQIALVPLLISFGRLNINGTFLAVWLAHTGFGLPLATYLLYNYISALPKETLESAFIDGASHFTVFTRLILPLSIPALASFCIFQFLWVWNDYLVGLIFLGGQNEIITMSLAEMVGTRGNDWHLLTAGAFVSMIVPLTVFFSLQRYFIRGLLAGSVKG
ncbi:MAG: carbohydrate ABC transporter permease [Chloroflexota bacterium]